ncbi:carbohydrate-binding protein [Terrimonas sp. NA20]|uniref:Carbohydrate-binding protein n=1 Tax=Terrimonas ginsenosidimutans TaxID=2908004 RepID=A0ABS9KLQ1_9BACT|nr:carbohydrate-binding protein [Terrimonas ginsenosidimutans]MCG2613251.1 carbohydrate-binding protein [Terrimonas ginsenosidimutans]
MRKITLFVCLCILACINKLDAQYLLIDDMEGHGPASGNWIYNAGTNATGSVIFNSPNPGPSSLNSTSHTAKFTKDTSCSAYMAAAVTLSSPLDLSAGATFRMMVYSNVKEDVMFKLQPGTDYTQAVFQTYRIQNVNQWEEAVFTFPGINHRTDLNRIAIQFIDGKKANGILYFDQIQAPNPTSLQFTTTNIPMGAESGKFIEVKLHGDTFKPVLDRSKWVTSTLPPGVSVDSIARINDTTARLVLAGNSVTNYSRTVLSLTVTGTELQNPNVASYSVKGSVVFDGNPNWTMIYNDEFDTDGLPDPTKWTIDARPKGWINNEQQVYADATRDNARVRNGNLVITGKKDFPTGDPNAPWSSARVVSLGKMEFLYGKAEMRAKLPRARGSWPAFWLMPVDNAYGFWPKSGEIDILEHVGNNFGKAMCAIHVENKNWTNGGNLGGNQIMPDVDTVYHTYGLEWSPDSLRFTHDGVGFYTYVNPKTDWKDWPFDKPFFVIMNVAIGGGMGGAITDADWPDSMQLDYVRIFQKGLGTPVLDSIQITPGDISVLPGKTQPFTAKVLDQNGHVMNGVTPTWSITGSGNTISSTGIATIQSSGVVTATATHDTVTLSGSTFINVRATNYKPVPARIEAEAFDNTNVCCTENTQDTSGVLNVSYIGKGSWFEYDISVPDSAAYRIRFRVAANSAAAVDIRIDTTVLSAVQIPATGGWQTWRTVVSAPIVFGPGQKTIRITSSASGWNFNWLQFVNAADHQVQSMAIQPDSARILVGETLQLKAIGRDAGNNFIMLSPSPVWSVNSVHAQVSAAGIFTSDSAGTYVVTATSGPLSDTSVVRVLGTPELTYILIKPDTLVVPVGASQQFTAKGYDQYDAQVPLIDSVYWTVTGAGNTITNNGLMNAGPTPGTYSVTATSGGRSGTLSLQTGYTCTVNHRYEAETASSKAAGLTAITTNDVDGAQHFENVTTGKWFAYSALKVPSAGKYNIRLRVSTTAAAKIRIGHGNITYKLIDLPSTGGQWQTISDTLTLPALSYTGIHGVSGNFKFNWFRIDNCATAPTPLATIRITPDTILLATGSQYLFRAAGYDSINNPVNLPPVQWAVNGTGNAIDSTGFLIAGTIPGSYAVTASADTVSGAALIQLVNCSVNNKYEAESFSGRHSAPVLETCTDIGGGENFTGLAAGHYFAYNTLNVPAAGVYRISLRILSTATSQVRIGHSSFTYKILSIPSTNGVWQTITDTLTLPALSYTGIHVVSGTFKFNYFMIDNCSADSVVNSSSSLLLSGAGNDTGDVTTGRVVYPNPASGMITIVPDSPEYRTVRVMNAAGLIIYNWAITPGNTRLTKDISSLKAGTYLLVFEGASKERKTVKLIKH